MVILLSSIYIQWEKNPSRKAKEETVPVLTRLSGLRVPALHVGLQEGVLHEGFIAEVALEREEKSAEGLGSPERGTPHVPCKADKVLLLQSKRGDLKRCSCCVGGM